MADMSYVEQVKYSITDRRFNNAIRVQDFRQFPDWDDLVYTVYTVCYC
jgi:hypothetical protein